MKDKVLERLKDYNQQHIIEHYMGLSGDEQYRFLNELGSFDLDLIFKIYRGFLQKKTKKDSLKISPAPVVPLPMTPEQDAIRKKARVSGEMLIKNNRVAVLIVAGGQGTRLGYDGPKGTFRISPVKGKTLFQLFTEQVIAISKRYSAKIPLLIMTSLENDDDTRAFFKENRYFGMDEDNIYFFRQGMFPTLTPDGKLIIKDRGQIATNPDGHGGSLKAINDSGLLEMLLSHGYTELFYCQVDNPLVKIADPVFLGYHNMAGSEVSTKVVRRRSIEEKVGVYLSVEGKDAIIEYSDLDASYMNALDEKGEILYWAGNTAIHIFSLPFVKRLNNHGFGLPYHCARKIMDIKTPEGNDTTIDVWKFETFVFDAIPLAKKTCAIEVKREEEFSPVKNMSGLDSPDKARDDMCALFKRWIEGTGAKVKPHIKVEISPLYAIDYDEFKNRFHGKGVTIEHDIYIGDL